jgi:3-dehydroquinate dehydratase type I
LEGIVGQSTKNGFEARIIGIVTAANRTDPAMWDALAECDIAELRADGFEAASIVEELRSFRRDAAERFGRPMKTLLTLRLNRDGGAWPDADAAAREPVWQALGLDGNDPLCDWVDVEVEEFGSLAYRTKTLLQSGTAKLLLSHHDFRRCRPREGLGALMGEMLTHKPDGMKFAVTCENRRDLLELLAFARDLAAATPHGCALSMGAEGRVSRVLGPLLGCPFTYGYLTGGAVAPGQISARGLNAFFKGMPGPGTGKPAGTADLAGMDDSDLIEWAEARIAGELLAD